MHMAAKAEGLTVKELLELALDEQIENSYSLRPAVVGYDDVMAGYKPLYPVTVYLLSGDDTSGIVGLLHTSGEFIPTPAPRTAAWYWEFDETLSYKQIPNDNPVKGNDGVFRVVGDSWATGEVIWDGTASEIEPHVDMTAEVSVGFQQDNGTMFVKTMRMKVSPHVRQHPDRNSLTGEWDTYRPGQRDLRKVGVVHSDGGEDKDGGFWVSGNRAGATPGLIRMSC